MTICGCCKRPMPEKPKAGLKGPDLVAALAAFLCDTCLSGIRARALAIAKKQGAPPAQLAKLGEPIH